MSGYLRRLVDGERPIGSSTEHYWRWPLMLLWRWRPMGVSAHGIRDGVVRGAPFHPAVRSFLWFGPIGIEVGWRRQRIEDWLWRRRLRHQEHR